MEEHKRNLVIPGEIITEGDNYLPGEGTEKRGNEICSFYLISYNFSNFSNLCLLSKSPITARFKPSFTKYFFATS